MVVLLAFHIPFLLHLNTRENIIFNDFIRIKKSKDFLAASITYINHLGFYAIGMTSTQ